MQPLAAEKLTCALEPALIDLINFMPDPCFAIDLQGKVLAWNPAIAELSGIETEDMLGKGNHEYAIPFYGIRRPILIDLALKWDKAIASTYKYVSQNGDILVCETENLRFAPEVSHLWGTARRMRNARGDCIGAIEVIREITEWKKSTERLKKSETEKALILNTTSEHISFYDLDLKIQWTNKATAECLGRPVNDLIGHFCHQVWHNRKEPCHRCPVIQAKHTGSPQKAEITTPDGRVWLVRGYPVLDEAGKVTSLIEFTMEITERKKAERALQHRLKFEQLVAGTSNRFANIESGRLDNAINDTLAAIGKFTGADRSYVIEFSDDFSTFFNTHQWCAETILPGIRNLQSRPATPLKWWMEKMKAGKEIFIQCVADLPQQARAEKKMLQVQNIISLLAVPIYCGSRLSGFIGFDSVQKHKKWINEDIRLLRTVSEIISGAVRRTQHEQALRQSENKFSKAFADSPGFLFISDFKTGEFIEVNRAYCELTGYSSADLISKTSLDLGILTTEQRTEMTESLTKIGKIKNIESKIRTKQGDIKTRILSAALVELQGKSCIVASGVDITERKQFELGLKKSEFEKSIILNVTSEYIAYFGPDLRLQWVNKAWADSLGGGKNLQFIIGKKCHVVRYNHAQPCVGCPVVKTRTTGRAEEAELKMADGRILNIRSYPVQDECGKLIAIINFSKDITEQKRVAQALKATHDELEEKVFKRTAELDRRNREIRDLAHKTIQAMENDRRALAKELHDSIGGTLAAIMYQLQSRVENVGSPPASVEFPLEKIISYIGDTIQESRRITKQLRPSVLDDFGLVAAIKEHIKDFSRFYADIKILQRISAAVENLSGDAKTVLYRVLQEALNNVGKHSTADNVNIRCQASKGWVRLIIKDNGTGFDVSHVFRNSKHMGGYGLHSMKERVEICNGEFQIESAPGKGTTVIAAVPMQSC